MAFEKPLAAKDVREKDFIQPNTCKCGRPADVSMATVVNNKTGAISRGASSEFCGRDNHNNPNWVLQDWYELRGVDGYCLGCWAGEAKPKSVRKYSDDQVRSAWLWLLGEHKSSGDVGRIFKRRSVSTDERDLYIEIVNYEAHRTSQPDAIPNELCMREVWM